jgi:AraC-like DNA-binding protein
VRPAHSVEDFLADPVGRCVAGRAYVAFMPSAALVGASHFGAFEDTDLPALRALFPLPAHSALVVPYDVLHDLSGVDVLDRRAFELVAQFLAQWMPQLVGRVRRLAVVRPAGFAGAAFTGLFHDFSAKFEAQLFGDRDAALAWLGVTDATRGELAAVLAPFEGVSPLLRRLRELLAGDPRDMTVERASSALGQSARSLQRHLGEQHTSFRDELARARVHAAKARLVETDDKIEVIARELGFRSVAAFTTMFGRELGEPPQAYRQRRRAT